MFYLTRVELSPRNTVRRCLTVGDWKCCCCCCCFVEISTELACKESATPSRLFVGIFVLIYDHYSKPYALCSLCQTSRFCPAFTSRCLCTLTCGSSPCGGSAKVWCWTWRWGSARHCHAMTERQDFIKIRPFLSVHPNHMTNDSLFPPFSSVSCLTRLLQVHLGHSTHSDDSDRSNQALSGLCWKSSGKGYKCIDCDDHIHNVFWCNNAFLTRVLGMQSSLCLTFIQAF